MLWKEIRDDQLFVFWNGVLIYKKWFRTRQSVILDIWGCTWWD